MLVSDILSIWISPQYAQRYYKNFDEDTAEDSNNPAYDLLFKLTYLSYANVPDQGLCFKEILLISELNIVFGI